MDVAHKLDSWKLNFDVAIRKSFAFAAVVCRNSEGHILFARTKRLPPCGPLVGEARAALFAAQEAFLLPFLPMILEGDSLLVNEAINDGGNRGDWQISTLLADICNLASCRDLWHFEHVKSDANVLAHRLVQWASSMS